MRTGEPRARRSPRLSSLIRSQYGPGRAADPLVTGMLAAAEASIDRLLSIPLDLGGTPPDPEPWIDGGRHARGDGRARPPTTGRRDESAEVALPPDAARAPDLASTLSDPTEAGLADLALAIATGALRAADLVDALLERADRIDPDLGAWEVIDRRGARAAARRVDRLVARGRGGAASRPLAGVPIGVKDVVAVRGLPLTAGFGPFRDRISPADADVVARLRGAGAIPLGMMVTTQFAAWHPARTANPWSAGRTPGGSSAGPAAGVAARLVPAAIGSQTAGSVLRPAAYCGIVGFKPTRGLISTKGVLPLAWSLDHVGFLARSVRDCRLLLACASRARAGRGLLRAEEHGEAAPHRRPPRVGSIREALDRSSAEVAQRARAAMSRAATAGAAVREIALGEGLDLAIESQRLIMLAEAGTLHRELLAAQPEEYAPRTRAALEVGAVLPAWAYLRAQRVRGLVREAWTAALADVDALVLPTVTAVAPDRTTTGDFSLQAPASLLGFPAISVPAGLDAAGLPIGIQLVGLPGGDGALLHTAEWLERLLGPLSPPPLAADGGHR